MPETKSLAYVVQDAIQHQDAGVALRYLKQIKKGQVADTVPGNVLEQLRYTALPALEIPEAAQILQSEVVKLLANGIDLDDRLSVRYAYTVYGEHEQERQVLKRAILGNKEQIGSKAIGQWLQEFDKAFPPETREDRQIFEFLSNNRQLNERDRAMLNLVLIAYEHWLAVEHLNIFDLAYLKQHPELLNQMSAAGSGMVAGSYAGTAAGYQAVQNAGGDVKTVKLPLLKALTDYPQLGNQLITAEKIKIKGQTEVQRPSLTNWIHYYRDQLGVGFHDEVARGHFLFQSENGKRLSADDREHISLILKSLEEDMPLEIDTERAVIVFPERAFVPPVKTAFIPSRSAGVMARPVKPYVPTASSVPQRDKASAAKPSFFASKLGPAKNVAGDTLEFSTGHVLPNEKAAVQTTPRPVPPIPTSAFNAVGINRSTGSALPRGPYSIRPLRLRNEEKKEG